MSIAKASKDNSFNELIAELAGLRKKLASSLHGFDLFGESLNLFSKYTDAESGCLFVLNKETFDFEPKKYTDVTYVEFYTNVYNDLSQSGAIGSALQNITYCQTHSEVSGKWHLIVPIVSMKFVKGLMVLTSVTDFAKVEIYVLKLISLYTEYIGLFLENQNLSEKNNRMQLLLDQLIASRTIELVENNAMLGEKIETLKLNLSMSVPHEVRTPINEIMGMSSYLLNLIANNQLDIEDLTEIITDIKGSAVRLNNLFENFIYHTRLSIIAMSIKDIEALHAQFSPYCEAIIQEQITLKAGKYGRGKDLKVNLVSSVIKIGEEYLAKLIDELMDNALKFSSNGTQVIVESHIEGDMYSLSIRDNGVGIPKEFLNQIGSYIQFNRGKNEQQGLGLGLAIAYKIVDLHNGQIAIDSELGNFTEVTAKIPIYYGYNSEFL